MPLTSVGLCHRPTGGLSLLTLSFLLANLLPAALFAQLPGASYVSPAGSDSNPGSLPAPFRTIQHAIDGAIPGNVVIVLEGRYAGAGNTNLDFRGKAITVQSRDPNDPACVRATFIDAEGRGVIARFVHDEGPDTVLAGFTVNLGDKETPVVGGIAGYIEKSRGAHAVTRLLRLEHSPAVPNSAAVPQLVFGMPGGTPVGGRAWDGTNPFVQPAATTDYWGSGDVDGDGQVTANDVTLADQMARGEIPATVTADVNGDGTVDAADVALIQNATQGAILPGWWNQLTTQAQRNAWVDRVMALDPTNNYTMPDPWFVCVQYATQTFLHGAFYRNDLFGTYYSGGQTWFNIPMYTVSLGIGHAIVAVLVGDNPLNMDDWRFIESENDSSYSPLEDYMPSGTQVDIYVPDYIQVGGESYEGGQALVSFLIGDQDSWTLTNQATDLVLTRPATPPAVTADNRPDFWNPHILPVGSGMVLFDRQRADMTRVDDVHITALPFSDPPPATPLVLDSQYSRLLDVTTGPDGTVHMLWTGGEDYLPGVFHGILNVQTQALTNITRVTPTAFAWEVHGGRILVTPAGDIHAFWSARQSSGASPYSTGVYWSQWNGAAWNAAQNVGASAFFSDYAGNWHDPDTARYFFDVVTEKAGSILLLWAAYDQSQNITLRQSRYDGSWNSLPDLESLGIAGGVALASDTGGTVHLAYYRTGSNASSDCIGNLMHRTLTDADWSDADTVDGGGNAASPRMVVASDGVYLMWQRNNGFQRILVWERWQNGAWGPEHLVSVPAGADAYYPAGGVLDDGQIAMAWSVRSADRATLQTAFIQEFPESNLALSLSHSGSFTQGDSSDTYQISVTNAGATAAAGTVVVSDTLPSGLTATAISGTGWSCTVSPLSCTRSDTLASGASFPVITLTVAVASNAAANLTNAAALSSPDEILMGANAASDPTTINARILSPALSISKTHTGNFQQGQPNAAYTITVSNAPQAGATSGLVSVSDTLPAGLTLVSMGGAGWSCNGATCTRSDALGAGLSYAPITVTTNVANDAASPLVNSASVTGGGSAQANTSDSTNVTANPPSLNLSLSHSGNFKLGQQGAVYTITVWNAAQFGPTSGTVSVTEAIPNGLTLVSMAGSGWTCTGATCSRTDVLTGGSSYPNIAVTVNVAQNATTPVWNYASVSAGGSNTGSNSDETYLDPNPAALLVSLSHTGNFRQGQLGAAYTITVANAAQAGPTAGNVTVTEAIPAGLTLASMAGSGWSCGSTSCTRSDALAGGATYPAITATVNVAANAASPLVNSVSTSGGGSDPANATDLTTVAANPPVLSVALSHTGSFEQGQQGATYAITVANGTQAGPTSGAVTLTESLPAGLTLVSMAGTGWTCVGPSCTRSDVLAGGASYPSIAATVNVAANAASPLVNAAGASGGGSVPATATDSTNITLNPPVLSVVLSHSGSFKQGQQAATYTITVANGAQAGPTSGAVTLTESLPAGMALASLSGAGWTCTGSSCTRSDVLAAGAGYPAISAAVNVAANAASPLVNTALVSGGGSASAAATDSTNITPNPPALGIAVTHTGNFVQGQQGDKFTVTVANTAQAGTTSSPVIVTENMPAGLSLVSMAGAGWACTGASCARSDALAGGAGYPSITATVNVAANAGSPLVNTAAVSGGGSAPATAADSVVVTPGQPVLTLAMSHTGDFQQGQQGAKYTVTVSNAPLAKPSSGTVTVAEALPAGMTLVSMAGTGWACTSTNCTRQDALPAGAAYPPITVTVNVAANAASPLVNHVSASGGGSSSTAATDTTNVIPRTPKLSIQLSHAGTFKQGQQNASYTAVVSNASQAAPTSGAVSVSEALPAGLTLVSLAGSGWKCSGSTCTRSDALSSGASYPAITATVNVATNAASPLANSISVSGGGSAAAQATDSTTITVNPPLLAVGVTHTGNFKRGQQKAAYTITVSNGTQAGPTSGAVTLTEILPSGLILVSMSGSGWSCSASTCTRSDVLNAGKAYPAVTVTVNVSATATSPEVNTVKISGGGSAAATATDSTVVTVN